MKNFQLAVAAVVAGCFFQGVPVAAQGSLGTYSKEAMDDLVGLLKKASQDGFTMEARTTTIFGGWLPKGNKQGNEPWIALLVLRNLDPNKSYRIVAAGDNDTRDLDLRILDPDGKVVGRFAATGIRPKFYEKLLSAGIRLRQDLFEEVMEI